MSIKCQICNKEFKSLINNTHLKSHGMTTVEYKSRFGEHSTVSDEYRKKRSISTTGENNPNFGNKLSEESKRSLSEKMSGRTPWNKGKKVDYGNKFAESIKNREEKYESGELTRTHTQHSIETKEKISESVKKYAEENKDKISQRAEKSVATKKQNGYDFAFFKGKTHSEDTKKKISQSSILTNAQKTQDAETVSYERAAEANLTILNLQSKIVELQCNSCHTQFSRTQQYLNANSKFKLDICPTCYPVIHKKSNLETEVADWIKSLDLQDVSFNNRTALQGKEIDILIGNLGIEINGLYWHSENILTENGYSKTKDYEKFKLATDNNIKLITVYEDEWINKKEIVKSRINGFLGNSKKIYARKCTIKEITSKQANTFLKENHLQGSGRSNCRYGLFFNDEFVSVMTFSKENISRKTQEWEINRFCTRLNTSVIGGASKLFSKFIRDKDPLTVISYSDNRWGDGNVYEKLNFEFEKETPPNYWYFTSNDISRQHRFSLRKNKSDNQSLTEWENRKLQGWYRIWDCGNKKYRWNKKPAH